MAKFCTNCGKELDDNAAMCLNCGVIVDNKSSNPTNSSNKEKKKGLPTWAIVLIVVGCLVLIPLIIFIVVGIVAYNLISDSDVDLDIDDYFEETATQRGTIGDTLKSDTFRIILTDALIYDHVGSEDGYMGMPAEGKEYLVFFFNIENISRESRYISDYDFDGYVDGYTVSTKYLFNEINGTKRLGADLSPNMKTIGYVAFEVNKTWQEFELHYSDWLDNEELVFTVVNENNSTVAGA